MLDTRIRQKKTSQHSVFIKIFVVLLSFLIGNQTAFSMDLPLESTSLFPDLVYDFYLGGVPLAEARLLIKTSETHYDVLLTVQSTGLVSYFFKTNLRSAARGSQNKGVLRPDYYDTRDDKASSDRPIQMQYKDGVPHETTAYPPVTRRLFELSPDAQQAETIDPLTALLNFFFISKADAQACNQSWAVYDGWRRYVIRTALPEETGSRKDKQKTADPQLHCRVFYERIAGFKPELMSDDNNFPFDIWIEHQANGTAIVTRIAGETKLGLAVVRIRR